MARWVGFLQKTLNYLRIFKKELTKFRTHKCIFNPYLDLMTRHLATFLLSLILTGSILAPSIVSLVDEAKTCVVDLSEEEQKESESKLEKETKEIFLVRTPSYMVMSSHDVKNRFGQFVSSLNEMSIDITSPPPEWV